MVGMTNGTGQRIGRVRLRVFAEFEEPADHALHLFLGGVATADGGFLDLQRRVFLYGQPGFQQGDKGGAARLPSLRAESALRAMNTCSMAACSG